LKHRGEGVGGGGGTGAIPTWMHVLAGGALEG
jgi:hypothetical protein